MCVRRRRLLASVTVFGLKVEEVEKKREDCDDHIVYQEKRAMESGKKRRSIDRTQSVTFIMLARKKSWPNVRIFPLGLRELHL
jgi:hypothetical protein